MPTLPNKVLRLRQNADTNPEMAPKKKLVVKLGLNALVQERVRKVVKLSTFKPAHKFYLDTGFGDLNGALGSRRRGLVYGRIIELRGKNHGGKTAIALKVAALGQAEGAAVGLIDLEQSRDRAWARKFGLVWEDMVRIWPKLLERKNKPPRLQTAEEVFYEAETAMAAIAKAGYKKQVWIVDSIAMIRTALAIVGTKKEQQSGKMLDRNMRRAADRAMFLSEKLPEWVGLAAGYNSIIILVNQMRIKPGVVYGDPRTSPGGNAMEHACAVRANVERISHGKLRNGGRVIGLVTKIENFKNKAGSKSSQDEVAVLCLRWDKKLIRVSAITEDEARERLGVKRG